MKTYEDLVACGENEEKRAEFCLEAIKEFQQSKSYKDALIADKYYRKHNVTIENYEKILYTVTGRSVKDEYSPNHRVKTHFFRRMVIQQANYILGSGVQLNKSEQKKKLGKNFDSQAIKAAKIAMVESRAFGYWNNDHLEVFGYCCTDNHAGFRPLYSEQDAEMKAGIRFWFKCVGTRRITFMTLYEAKGISEYRQDIEGKLVFDGFAKYKRTTSKTPAEGVLASYDSDYNDTLPIVPLYASDTYESELVGIREAIDSYDLIKSGLANNIDEASEIYWLVSNAGGMDDVDLARFLQRIKTVHAAATDSQSGTSAEAHTLDIPVEARKQFLELARTDLYDDMMLIDRRNMSAAQKTTQELDMAYQPQDDKINDFEFFLMDFFDAIFALAGVDSEVTLRRNKVVNKQENTAMVLSAANYISPECVIRHLDFLTPEEQEEEIKKYEDEQHSRFFAEETEPEEDPEQDPEQDPEEMEGEE